jgi:hypothetical protein
MVVGLLVGFFNGFIVDGFFFVGLVVVGFIVVGFIVVGFIVVGFILVGLFDFGGFTMIEGSRTHSPTIEEFPENGHHKLFVASLK